MLEPNNNQTDSLDEICQKMTLEDFWRQNEYELYSLCSESYEQMQELMTYIDTACMTCETLWCKELYGVLGLICPNELKQYGWRKPRQYLDRGYFYLYAGGDDNNSWHIKCPNLEKLEG